MYEVLIFITLILRPAGVESFTVEEEGRDKVYFFTHLKETDQWVVSEDSNSKSQAFSVDGFNIYIEKDTMDMSVFFEDPEKIQPDKIKSLRLKNPKDPDMKARLDIERQKDRIILSVFRNNNYQTQLLIKWD